MNKMVLLIDNNPDCLEVMKEAVMYGGFEVATDDGNHEIFTTLNAVKPDLVLIDFLLDGINGGEICSQIKKDSGWQQLPVVIVSAYPKVLASLGTYGCDLFLPKPFDIEDMIIKIQELVYR